MSDELSSTEVRQHARRILLELARTINRRLSVEVREIPGQQRLQVSLSHGTQRGQIELALKMVLGADDDAVARNDLRLRLKRAHDTMMFRPMPDHRLTVKPVPPPGGNLRRGQGRR